MKHCLRHVMIAAGLVVGTSLSTAASAQTIVDEWATVKVPPPPELKPVTIDNVKETAFLVLDIQRQNCNNQRRPRCVVSVPKIQKFLEVARAKGMPVIYSRSSQATVDDILPEVAPRPDEPLVAAPADKFVGSDLEKILKEKGIKTVIVVGAAAHGAVLYTATGAAYRRFKVIVPVDGMSSENTYFEQYVAYQLANVPGSAVTLTTFDMVKF
jgi:nicotinamidase-related amidase